MTVIDSFVQIFDKVSTHETKDTWVVDEADTGASFKHLKIQNTDNIFYVIENSVYKHWKVITECKSNLLKDLDCDGVAITMFDHTPVFLLCELKTALDTKKIFHAMEQIIFSYIKLYMLFSLCKDLDSENYSLVGIISCKPPKNESQETFLKSQLCIQQQKRDGDLSSISLYTARLFYEHKLDIEIGKIPFLKDKLLSNKIRKKKITIFLKTAKSYEQDSAIFNIKEEFT